MKSRPSCFPLFCRCRRVLLSALLFAVWLHLPARTAAQSIVVAIVEGTEGQTLQIPVRAHAASGISAAACRVVFDADSLDVRVTSSLFAGFATQFSEGGVVNPASVVATVDGVTFDAPFLVRSQTRGLTIAGARRLPSDAGDQVVFTLGVRLKAGAAPGLYPITLESAVAAAMAAGYPAGGEAVPLLIGYDQVAGTYPVIAAITPGNNPVTPGSAQFNADDPDRDRDGLADAWERRFYGNLEIVDGASDTDGDSFNALMEQVFATDPTRPNGDAVAAVGAVGDAFIVQFPLLANTRVAVEWSTDSLTWSAEGVSITPRSDLGSGSDWTMQRASVPANGRSRLLMRVRGIIPEPVAP